jgi:hypothetical protein
MGNCSIILGGLRNTTQSNYNLAYGCGASTTRYGQQSWSVNSFNNPGDNQKVEFLMSNITTTATPTKLYLDGVGATFGLTIPTNKSLFLTISISAVQENGIFPCGIGCSAHYIRKVAVKNVGGTTQLIVGASTVGTDVENNASWNFSLTANNVLDELEIFVTGQVGANIRWTAHVVGVEMSWI